MEPSKRKRIKIEKPACPNCRQRDNVVPYIWGEPPGNAQEIEEKENIKYAFGCMIFKDSPNWYCKACEASFLNKEHRTGDDFWLK